MTAFNPYLVALLTTVTREEFYSLVGSYMADHVDSILSDMDKFKKLEHFSSNEFEEFYYWASVAENNIIINKREMEF